jgi:hypothetical protein
VTKPVLIIGASGRVGRALTRVLLKTTPVNLRLASRNPKTADKLCQGGPWLSAGRLQPFVCDASDQESLERAMLGVSVTIVCSATRDQIEKIARAALRQNCDLIDIHSSPTQWNEARAFRQHFIQTGRTWITEAGCRPGLPGVLLKWTKQHLDMIDSAKISVACSLKHSLGPCSGLDFLKEASKGRKAAFREGRWKEGAQVGMETITEDFGEGFGRRLCTPCHLPELVQVSTDMEYLHETGFYVAEGPWALDKLAAPLAMMLSRAHRSLAKPAASLLRRATQWVPETGVGIVTLLNAKGTARGEAAELKLRLRHVDSSEFTALCVACCLDQWSTGTLPKGVYMMAEIVKPELFLADLFLHGADAQLVTKGIHHEISLSTLTPYSYLSV